MAEETVVPWWTGGEDGGLPMAKDIEWAMHQGDLLKFTPQGPVWKMAKFHYENDCNKIRIEAEHWTTHPVRWLNIPLDAFGVPLDDQIRSWCIDLITQVQDRHYREALETLKAIQLKAKEITSIP